MSFDPHQQDIDQEVDASMRMFERAKVGAAPKIAPAKLQRALICPDGSSQDAGVLDAANFLASRFASAELRTLDARESHAGSGEITSLLAGFQSFPLLDASGEAAYDKILSAVDAFKPDLVVLPSPFGRDFQSIGADSVGTVLDVLLHRCRVPLLVIRGDNQPLVEACKRQMLVVGAENEGELLAAAWGFSLASSGSQITLNLVIDREQVENVRQLLAVLAPEQRIDHEGLSGALAKAHTQLDLSMHKTALELGIDYRMEPTEDLSAKDAQLEPALLVLPLERDDQFGHGFVANRIRHSHHPVLIAPR